MTEIASFSTSEDLLAGTLVLGRAMQGDPFSISSILCGSEDRRLSMMTFYRETVGYAKSEEDLKNSVVVEKVENIKRVFRSLIQGAIDAEERQEKNQKDREAEAKAKIDFENLAARLRQSNKPHPMGTVDELAKKFGVSKSEVRRRKSDGTLGELLMDLKSPS